MRKRSFIANLQVVCITVSAAITAMQSHADNINTNQIKQANRQAIEQNNRRALQENQRKLNKQLQPKPTKNIDNPEVKEVEAEGNPVLKETHQCLPISGVYVTETSLLSPKDFEKLTPIDDSCILPEDVNQLIREITGLYVSKGFVTARIVLLQPGIYGELGLEIIEGKIEAIVGESETINTEMLFPNSVGQPLNLRDLEQGIDQANRLQSNKISMRLLPGEYRGGSIIQLSNPQLPRWSSNASIDNHGQENTGREVLRAMTVYSSPLGLSDYISFSGSTTLGSNPDIYSRSISTLYSIPYGYWTYSAFGFYSSYSAETKTNTVFNAHGWSSNIGVRADKTISRDGNVINTLSGQFNYKQAKNFLETVQLNISSQDLAVFSIDYSHFRVLSSGVFSAGLGIDRGTSFLNAQTHSNAVNNVFTKLRGNITTSYSFLFLEDTYLYQNKIVGQYSEQHLPGVEWIGISDNSAVRGLDKNNLSATDGWYFRNTLSRDFPAGPIKFTPRFGLDYGQINAGIESGFDKAVGASLGQRITYKQASFDLEVSKAWVLNSPEYKQESVLVLARMGIEF